MSVSNNLLSQYFGQTSIAVKKVLVRHPYLCALGAICAVGAIGIKMAHANTQISGEVVPVNTEASLLPDSEKYVLDSTLKLVTGKLNPETIKLYKALSKSEQLVMGLWLIRENAKGEESYLENISYTISALTRNPIVITSPPHVIIDLFNKFNVIQLRPPSTETLVIGCGNSNYCGVTHANCDTLCDELYRNPTFVTDWGDQQTVDFFAFINKKYNRILDEGPIVLWTFKDRYDAMIKSILVPKGTFTLPNINSDPHMKAMINSPEYTRVDYTPSKETYNRPSLTLQVNSPKSRGC